MDSQYLMIYTYANKKKRKPIAEKIESCVPLKEELYSIMKHKSVCSGKRKWMRRFSKNLNPLLFGQQPSRVRFSNEILTDDDLSDDENERE